MEQWIVVFLQSIGIFLLVFLFVKLMGKRQPARMIPFMFVTYVVIGMLAALISIGFVPLTFGIIAIAVWALLPILVSYVALRSKFVHDFLFGKETVVIKHGKIMEENLEKVKYSPEELLQHLRTKNIFNTADVEFAVLEPTGEINAMLKADKTPLTPHHLGIKVAPQVEPQTVILDGSIMDEPLQTAGLNRRWLKEQLDKMGISPENVFIGQVDATGELIVDLFDDAIQIPKPQVKEMLYASLEQAQANLYSFSLDTEDEQAKKTYQEDAAKLEEVIEKLKPYLLR